MATRVTGNSTLRDMACTPVSRLTGAVPWSALRLRNTALVRN
ncbi:MAG: hypothetical protein P1U83_15400 [Roseovarius sp.]|nr:hypothetical protein [Roseovarius sp.]